MRDNAEPFVQRLLEDAAARLARAGAAVKDAALPAEFADIPEAREFLAACRRALDRFFEDHDVLLTPAAAGEAPVGLHSTGYTGFCAIWTSAHVPAVTLPVLRGPNGLPVGVQLVARRDRGLLACARWIARALG